MTEKKTVWSMVICLERCTPTERHGNPWLPLIPARVMVTLSYSPFLLEPDIRIDENKLCVP